MGMDSVGMGYIQVVFFDIVVVMIIVIIAAALGLVVHPLLWFIAVVALLWLFTRRSRWSRV